MRKDHIIIHIGSDNELRLLVIEKARQLGLDGDATPERQPDDFCIRLNFNGGDRINWDCLRYYQNAYSELPIVSVEEFLFPDSIFSQL